MKESIKNTQKYSNSESNIPFYILRWKKAYIYKIEKFRCKSESDVVFTNS